MSVASGVSVHDLPNRPWVEWWTFRALLSLYLHRGWLAEAQRIANLPTTYDRDERWWRHSSRSQDHYAPIDHGLRAEVHYDTGGDARVMTGKTEAAGLRPTA